MSSTITSLKDVFVDAVNELLPMFGLESEFLCEMPESALLSKEPVNILLGLTCGLKGSIVLQLTKDASFKIVSAMMGGMEITELDMVAKSALGEFTNMLGGTALGKLNSEVFIDISPPTLAVGENIFLSISRVPAKKICFKFGDTEFNISYCIE